MSLTRKLILSLVLILLSASLSGCFLRSIFGNVIVTSDISEFVDHVVAATFSEATVAVCHDQGLEGISCTYIIDGWQETSTFYLITELGYQGILIDPLILQIPDNATNITATYDAGAGPQPALVHTPNTFPATPDALVYPEEGQKFVIVELPPEAAGALPGGDPTNGTPIDFAFSFESTRPLTDPPAPLEIKALLTVKVTINGRPYYVPTLPCTTDFASIPAIQLPVSNQPVSLAAGIGDLLRASDSDACFHEPYFFDTAPPQGSERMYLPIILH